MISFYNKFLLSFFKKDTMLAFIISFILYYLFNNSIFDSIKFSACFVVVFLFCLSLIAP